MVDERFTTFHFTTPWPMSERRIDWKHCGRCGAGFYIRFADLPEVREVRPLAPPVAKAPGDPAGKTGLAQQLTDLSMLHRSGALTDNEFTCAKRRCLGVTN